MAKLQSRFSQDQLEGYSFPVGVSKIQPIYYPSIHQIWIPHTVPDDILPLVRAHEAMHVCTISFQPPQFIPLSLRLGGTPYRVGKNHFKDIVETVCEACLWAQTNLGIEDISLVIENSQHPKILAELFYLAQKSTVYPNQITPNKAALKEIVIGLCMLLIHIIPLQPNLGLDILQIISTLSLNQGCLDRWQVFYSLHSQLSEQWRTQQDIQRRIILSLPMDMHRSILDLVMFLSLAIRSVTISSSTVTSVFPALLGILTLGGFELLPFIYLHKCKSRYEVMLDVIHTTSTRHADPLAYVQANSFQSRNNMQSKMSCAAISITQAIEDESKQYMFSDSPDRTWRCFGCILNLLPDLLKSCLQNNSSCQGCTVCFSIDESFENACNTVINMQSDIKEQLIESTKNYERYLYKDSIQHMKHIWKLPTNLQVVKCFSFL